MVLGGEGERCFEEREWKNAGGLRCSGAADVQSETDGDNVLHVLRVRNFKCHEVEKSTNMHLQIYENICNAELFKQIADVDSRCRCVVYHASQLERTVKPQNHRFCVGFFFTLHYSCRPLHDGIII